eukprot:SAG31_NODE_3634_length_4036_cov_10.699517_8_plen_94_part_00
MVPVCHTAVDTRIFVHTCIAYNPQKVLEYSRTRNSIQFYAPRGPFNNTKFKFKFSVSVLGSLLTGGYSCNLRKPGMTPAPWNKVLFTHDLNLI